MNELTPWFPPEVKPVRKGIYLATVIPNETFYRYWTGRAWLTGGATVEQAAYEIRFWAINKTPIHWRGLAQEPKQ